MRNYCPRKGRKSPVGAGFDSTSAVSKTGYRRAKVCRLNSSHSYRVLLTHLLCNGIGTATNYGTSFLLVHVRATLVVFWDNALENRTSVLPISEQHTEESLCFAHIYALAGVAGVNHSVNRYDYGVDGTFIPVARRGNRLIDTGFPLDFQAKATINWSLSDGQIVYDLEAKTYNDLATRTAAESSMILILLCLPKDREDWHATTCDSTIMRNCCYWYTISDQPTDNSATKRIHIPTENLLTPATLKELLRLERQRRESQLR